MQGCLLIVFLGFLTTAIGAEDPQNPAYHFYSQWWLNDPNGPVYYNGFYHLFWQYTPNSVNSGLKYWGHAYSKDLVTWTKLPVAISPTPGTYDANGIWSGSTTITYNQGSAKYPLVAYYTGISPSNVESQNVAFPSDPTDPTLTKWTKYSGNPVIPDVPKYNASFTGFRDPTTAWFEDGVWRLAVGSGNAGKGGLVLLYESKDAVNWQFAGYPLYAGVETPITGDMFECPDFYQISPDLHILKVSYGGDVWITGKYTHSTPRVSFAAIDFGKFDQGNYYASKSFWDTSKNRRITFGWVQEEDNNATARGWASMMSLPRVLSLDPKTNWLIQTPLPELQTLRGSVKTFQNISASSGSFVPLQGLAGGDQVEILLVPVQFDSSVTSFGLRVRASPSGNEYTDITILLQDKPEVNIDRPGADYHYHPLATLNSADCIAFCLADPLCQAWTIYMNFSQPLCTLKQGVPGAVPKQGTTSGLRGSVGINRDHSSLNKNTGKGGPSAPVIGPPSSFRIFIDHSVVEVYANGGSTVFTTRIYPTLADSQGVSLFAVGGTVVADVNVWPLASIW